jgi:hypothetical protein
MQTPFTMKKCKMVTIAALNENRGLPPFRSFVEPDRGQRARQPAELEWSELTTLVVR